MLIKFGAPGEFILGQPPGLAAARLADRFGIFMTCGVMNTWSSGSSGSIGSSPSESLLDESDASMFTLPTELGGPALPDVPNADHSELGFKLGDSPAIEILLCLRVGIMMPF